MISRTILLRSGLLLLICLHYSCSSVCQDDSWRMRRLHAAEIANQAVWNDFWYGGNVDVVQAIDSKGQEHRANRAFRELQHCFPLSKAEFDGATWVSPRSISQARKDLVIGQLHRCVKQQGWRGEHMSEADQADIFARFFGHLQRSCKIVSQKTLVRP